MQANLKIQWNAYWELAKPRILLMSLLTLILGFWMGGEGFHSISGLLLTLSGAAFCFAGSASLNHYLERDADSLMERTKNRPIQRGDVSSTDALVFGVTSILFGLWVLVSEVNLMTGFLALLTAFLYVLVYTPLKPVTWWNTTIGAIPGALPPLIGSAAATGGHLAASGWFLFLVIFLWQHPHFYSIAWMHKDDYRKAGFQMLSVVDPNGKSLFPQITAYSLVLLLVSLLPCWMGHFGNTYLYGVLLCGVLLVAQGLVLQRTKSLLDAKRYLKATVIYLPALLILMVADGGF